MANNTMNDENKKKALDAAIAKLEKDFGKGAVMKLGDPAAQVHVETVPTGSLSLDTYDRRSTEKRRHCGIYRCRACTGSGICEEYRCRY